LRVYLEIQNEKYIKWMKRFFFFSCWQVDTGHCKIGFRNKNSIGRRVHFLGKKTREFFTTKNYPKFTPTGK
jgi:hypothetical protein